MTNLYMLWIGYDLSMLMYFHFLLHIETSLILNKNNVLNFFVSLLYSVFPPKKM